MDVLYRWEGAENTYFKANLHDRCDIGTGGSAARGGVRVGRGLVSPLKERMRMGKKKKGKLAVGLNTIKNLEFAIFIICLIEFFFSSIFYPFS